jgi:hypothetical protein
MRCQRLAPRQQATYEKSSLTVAFLLNYQIGNPPPKLAKLLHENLHSGLAKALALVRLLQFSEDPEQRLASVAESVVDSLAAAVRLHQLRGLQPREVG